jgi:hypothetical protein
MPAREVILRPFLVNPKAVHEFIVMPQFGDVLDDSGNVTQPSMEEGDWQVMDNVIWRRPILELTGQQNVLKRRDATCKLIYSPVGKLGARYIFTDPLYAATEDCVEEFYQGCFIDYEQGNFDMFFSHVMPIMETAVATDLYTNKYFGDVTRAGDVTGTFSWNKFDGVFTKLNQHIADGTTPASQTFVITTADGDGVISPIEAHDALSEAYARQGFMMRNVDKRNKAFYVDVNLYDAYWDWLVLAGQSTVAERQAAASAIQYKGIDIRPKYWDTVLQALNGGDEAHVVMLTIRANWLYATDSSYGGGPRRNEAIRIWYSMDDNVWRRQIHLKAGTEWVNPQYVVIGMTEIS